MAGLIGLGRIQADRAQNTLRKGAEMELQRNTGNKAMAANKRAQEMSTMGTGAGIGAYYGVTQAGTTAAATASGATGAAGTTSAMGSHLAGLAAKGAGTTAATGTAATTTAAAQGAAAGGAAAGGGALATAASAIPYIAAGIAVAALFNKLFD